MRTLTPPHTHTTPVREASPLSNDLGVLLGVSKAALEHVDHRSGVGPARTSGRRGSLETLHLTSVQRNTALKQVKRGRGSMGGGLITGRDTSWKGKGGYMCGRWQVRSIWGWSSEPVWRGAWSLCEVRDVPHIPVHAHSFRPHLLVLQLFTVHEGQVQEIAQRVGQLSSGARHLRADKPYMR